MKRCWDANPDKRPEMDEVVAMIEAIDTSRGGGMLPVDQPQGCFCFRKYRGPWRKLFPLRRYKIVILIFQDWKDPTVFMMGKIGNWNFKAEKIWMVGIGCGALLNLAHVKLFFCFSPSFFSKFFRLSKLCVFDWLASWVMNWPAISLVRSPFTCY